MRDKDKTRREPYQARQTATEISGVLPDSHPPGHQPPERSLRQWLVNPDMTDANANFERQYEEQRMEEEIYRDILSRARNDADSLRSLAPLMRKLHNPRLNDSRDYTESACDSPCYPNAAPDSEENMRLELGGMDSNGNPNWISLTLPQRDEDASMPGTDKNNVPGSRTRFEPPTAAPHKPRPMRSLIRMLLVTAILGMLYHILSLKGWVPRLF